MTFKQFTPQPGEFCRGSRLIQKLDFFRISHVLCNNSWNKNLSFGPNEIIYNGFISVSNNNNKHTTRFLRRKQIIKFSRKLCCGSRLMHNLYFFRISRELGNTSWNIKLCLGLDIFTTNHCNSAILINTNNNKHTKQQTYITWHSQEHCIADANSLITNLWNWMDSSQTLSPSSHAYVTAVN